VLIPASAASASAHKASLSFTCPAAAPVSTAAAGTFGAPKKQRGFENGAGLCSYRSSADGKLLIIAHSPVGKVSLKSAAKSAAGAHGHYAAVAGVGTPAYAGGSGKVNFILTEKGKDLYEVLDYTKTLTEPQLQAVLTLDLPA
jgi:hypothetical protein